MRYGQALMGMLVLFYCIIGCDGQQNDHSVFKGPYFGQTPPGRSPELFAPGMVSTGLTEGTCCFSPGGEEAYWIIGYAINRDRDVRSAIVYSRLKDGEWTIPELVDFVSTDYVYAYPFLTYDGEELYFISNEPTHDTLLNDEYNIWVTRRNGDGWNDPVPLPYPINGRGITSGPSVSQTGVLYYTLITEEEQAIYRSRIVEGAYSEPERLSDAVNSTDNQFDGVISPDESYMLLPVYNRHDSYGSVDLYITFRSDQDKWSPVANLGTRINTERVESAARISPDGKYIFLSGLYETHNWGNDSLSYSDIVNHSSKPGFGRADIYWISSSIIEEFRQD